MAIKEVNNIEELFVTSDDISSNGVQSRGERLEGTVEENKRVFDALPSLIADKYNSSVSYFNRVVPDGTKNYIDTQIDTVKEEVEKGSIDQNSLVNLKVGSGYSSPTDGNISLITLLDILSGNTKANRDDIISILMAIDANSRKTIANGQSLDSITTVGTYDVPADSAVELPKFFFNASRPVLTVEITEDGLIIQRLKRTIRVVSGSIKYPAGLEATRTFDGSQWTIWDYNGTCVEKIDTGAYTTSIHYRINGDFLECWGHAVMTPTKANTTQISKITFPYEFAYQPTMSATFTGAPTVPTLHVSTSEVTKSNFKLCLFAGTSLVERGMNWRATGRWR